MFFLLNRFRIILVFLSSNSTTKCSNYDDEQHFISNGTMYYKIIRSKLKFQHSTLQSKWTIKCAINVSLLLHLAVNRNYHHYRASSSMDSIRSEQQLVDEFAKIRHANLENISGVIIEAV